MTTSPTSTPTTSTSVTSTPATSTSVTSTSGTSDSGTAMSVLAAAAQHRPAPSPRGSRPKDSIVALDMFSGAGGSSHGIEAAGIDVWFAANHWEYAVAVHEANHPGAEHFIADLVDPTAADYYHPEMLPAADVLWASPSCVHHTKANAQRAYRRNLSIFDIYDEEYEARVTESERSRATAVCVLQYARKHRPKVVAVENVVEWAQWGPAVDGSNRGDGTSFRWWLDEFTKLGYRYRILWLNSMFFNCPQSRDRMYVALWQDTLPTPDLDHRPVTWCGRCDDVVEAVQVFKARTKAWPLPQWGKYLDQYTYRCPRCQNAVTPPAPAAATAIDWSDLGQRIGDRDRPLAPSTLARIARGVERFGSWPANVTAAGAFLVKNNGPVSDAKYRAFPVSEPFGSLTTQPTQGLVSTPLLLTDRGTSNSAGLRPAKLTSVAEPMGTVSSGGNHHFLLSPLFAKQNGGPADTAWHQARVEPFNTVTGRDTTCLVTPTSDAPVSVEDCLYRMLQPDEIKAGMGLPPEFTMWGTARDRVKALGNAVTPPVACWIMERLAAVLR